MYSEQLLTSFVHHVQAVHNQFMKEQFSTLSPDKIVVEEGPKNVRIVKRGTHSGSVYGFIRKSDGAILRAASYKTLTKIVMGNLEDYPDRVLGAYGVAYVSLGHYSYRPKNFPPRTPETLPSFFGWTDVPSFTDFPILLDWLEEKGRMDDVKKVKDLYGIK